MPLPLLCGILEPSANSIFRTVCVCVPLPLLYGILEPSANLIFLQLLCPCIFSIPCQLYLKCWLLCTVLAGHSRPLANPIFTFVLSLHRPGPPLANSIYFVGVIVLSWRGTPAPLPTPFTLFLSLQHPGGTLPPPCQLYLHYFLSLHCPGETLPPPCQLYLHYCCPCTIPAGHYRPLANAIFTSSHASSAYFIIRTEIPQFWRIARANNVQIIMCKLHMLPEPLPSYLHSAQPGGGGGSANTGFVFNQTYFE